MKTILATLLSLTFLISFSDHAVASNVRFETALCSKSIQKKYILEKYCGSLIDTETGEVQQIAFRLYRQDDQISRPLVILEPNLSPIDWMEKSIARHLAKNKTTVLFLEKITTLGKYFSVFSRFNLLFSRQVLITDEALTQTLTRLPAPPSSISIFGISLGAVLSAYALGTDQRIDSGVIFLGGAGFVDAEEPGLVANIGKLVKRLKTKSASTTEASFLDPIQVAAQARKKRIFMFMTEKDEIIPPARQRELWSALGEPPHQVLAGNHLGEALGATFRKRQFSRILSELTAPALSNPKLPNF